MLGPSGYGGRVRTVPFTERFLDVLVEDIMVRWVREKRPLDRLAVVFGGQRPAHFLRRALARRLGHAFLPPRCYAMDDFIAEVSGAAGAGLLLSDLEARHEIYLLARSRHPALLKGRETFARFLPWAGEVADLIGELDLEDVPPERLRQVEQSARIGYPVPEAINDLLTKMQDIRAAFHTRVLGLGRVTRGLRYLKARERVADWTPPFDEIIFANFFYLHRTEEAVLKDLHHRGLASLFFQGDRRRWPALTRAGRAFAADILEPGPDGNPAPEPRPTTFRLAVSCAPDTQASAAAARDALSAIPRDEWGDTVLVLPDPLSLVPLLSALPQDCDALNVSTGYPLGRGSLVQLLRRVFRAQLSRRDGAYYARDYLAVLRHPLVKNLRSLGDPAATRILVHKVEEALRGTMPGPLAGRRFVALADILQDDALFAAAGQLLGGEPSSSRRAELREALETLHRLFFGEWEELRDLRSLAAVMDRCLDTLRFSGPLRDYPLNTVIAARLAEWSAEWERAPFAAEPLPLRDLFRIVENMIEGAAVRFRGTPLRGLQVLGLFETRALNFRHVIVLDANEGVLPAGGAGPALVPREVLVHLGIDRLKIDEEIQRYHFMRLIAGARDVHLVYQKNREKEPSRFLEELVWEQQRREGVLKPYPTRRVVFAVDVRARPREIAKTPAMMDFLRGFSFSASSVNSYVRNPYEFYLRYVAGLRERDDLLDEPDAAQAGTFLHALLEEIYRPFAGRPLAVDEAFRRRAEELFALRFEGFYGARARSDAFMVKAVMQHKLRQFLEYEEERLREAGRVLTVEEEAGGVLALPSGPRRFKARVDRVEERPDGSLLVLDYKTGGADQLPRVPLPRPAAWTRELVFEHVRSFQLPLYMQLVGQRYPGQRVAAGLYSLREVAVHEFRASEAAPYLEPLDAMLAEIMDPARPFLDSDLG